MKFCAKEAILQLQTISLPISGTIITDFITVSNICRVRLIAWLSSFSTQWEHFLRNSRKILKEKENLCELLIHWMRSSIFTLIWCIWKKLSLQIFFLATFVDVSGVFNDFFPLPLPLIGRFKQANQFYISTIRSQHKPRRTKQKLEIESSVQRNKANVKSAQETRMEKSTSQIRTGFFPDASEHRPRPWRWRSCV